MSALWIFKLKGNFIIIMLVTLTSHSNVMCVLMCTNLNNHIGTIVQNITKTQFCAQSVTKFFHWRAVYQITWECTLELKMFALRRTVANLFQVEVNIWNTCSMLIWMKKQYNATCAVISSKHHQTSVITCPVFITSFPGGLSPRNKT